MNARLDFPLPPGTTQESLWTTMSSMSIDDSPKGALEPYVVDSFGRFLRTWDLARDLGGNCLELGANPYFTSWLLHEYTPLKLSFANFFGMDSARGAQTLSWQGRNGRESLTIDFDHFNLESSRFPYPDASFDCVLFCEILEHLLNDPLHSLREISRVLKPNGRLILTTPNVARMGNVRAMVEGRSIYDPYSGFGPYGRHNREYSLDELTRLLRFAGFEMEKAFTADSHEDGGPSPEREQLLSQLVSHRAGDLGQYLFVRAVRTSDPRSGFPSWLYRSLPAGQLVD